MNEARGDVIDRTARMEEIERLNAGVARGIITAAQRDALLSLEDAHGDDDARRPVEAPRGLNGVTLAYWTGAIAVLAAFGWFLISKWEALGPGGVLIVVTVYAGLFVFMARVLREHGFQHGAAIATLLAVGMTPLGAWAILSLAGLWDLNPGVRRPYYNPGFYPAWYDVRWLPVDLATILAALVALRRVRFGVLALPIAIALWAVGGHLIPLILDRDIIGFLSGRLLLLPAVVLLGIGYGLDVRAPDAEDYAVWFYVVGLVALTASLAGFYGESKGLAAHATVVVAGLLAVAALRLRRRIFLFAALLGLISYLGYLIFEVFGSALGFPVALATVGLVVILAAVLLQRRYPALVRRAEASGRREIAGAPIALAGALAIAIALILAGIPDARQRVTDRYEQERADRARMHNAKKREALFGPPAARSIRPRPVP